MDSTLLAEKGPVDAEVARQMAQGARRLMGAKLSLSTTGVAGPGPAEGHEVGTVHIALAWSKEVVHRMTIKKAGCKNCSLLKEEMFLNGDA